MSPSRTSPQLCNLLGAVRGFANASSGLAATEFALIAPVMIVMYFGLVEFTLAQDAKTKSSTVASTAADLIAQEKEVCDAEVTDTFAALNAIMFPFAINNMQVRVSSVVQNPDGTYKVAWSDAQHMPARAVNSPVTVPAGLVSTGGSVIMSETNYTYVSPAQYLIPTSLSLTDTYYLHPRKAAQITRTAACT